MAPKPKKAKRSPAQVAASKAWASAGRASQARKRAAYKAAHRGAAPPRSAKQQAASSAWAAAGRAARSARSAGKTPVSKKKAAAPAPVMLVSTAGDRVPIPHSLPLRSPASGELALHELPACAPVALAEHLALFTGILVTDEQVLALHNMVRDITLADLLEYTTVEGFAGHRLKSFRLCDPAAVVPGMLCGVMTPGGYHAVLAVPAGMLSWDVSLSWPGPPREAWYLEWNDG